jgi:hypothetical protein
MAFMELQTYRKGRLATCECSHCGTTHYWHEWTSDGQADDLKESCCNECGRALDPETYWESPSRNWYACRYSAPGYMDCTDYSYGTNRRKLEREVSDMYGD